MGRGYPVKEEEMIVRALAGATCLVVILAAVACGPADLENRLERLEAAQALDVEFEMVVRAYLAARSDRESWFYKPKKQRSFVADPWTTLAGFNRYISGLNALADYRLESSGRIVQLIPPLSIERLSWEDGDR
jgi:hypothetical protein